MSRCRSPRREAGCDPIFLKECNMIGKRIGMACVATSALAMLLGGCDREVSHTGSAKVDKDGSTQSQETVIKQSPDGTVTKRETSKSTDSDGESDSKTTTTIQSPDGSVSKEQTKTTTPPASP